MKTNDLIPSEVYGSGKWHEPLLLDDELEQSRENNVSTVFHQHGNPFTVRAEALVAKAWNDAPEPFDGTLTPNLFFRSISTDNEGLCFPRFNSDFRYALISADISLGELFFISARMPCLLLEASESQMKYELRTRVDALSTPFGNFHYERNEETLAWVLLLCLRTHHDTVITMMDGHRKAREAGLSFDTTAQYVEAGVTNIDTIIKMAKSDVDPHLAASL